jgi:methyl-accepting chemotaxis protein
MFQNLITFFVPPRAASLSVAAQRRFRLFIVIQLLAFLLALVSSTSFLTNLSTGAAAMEFALVSAATLLLVRFQGSLRISVNVGVGLMYCVAVLSLWRTGGILSSTTWLLTALPILPLLFLGRNAGLMWGAVSLLIIVGFTVAQQFFDVTLPMASQTAGRAFFKELFALFVISGITQLFVGDREIGEARLREEKAATQQKVDEAVARLKKEQEAMHLKDEQMLKAAEEQQHYLERSISAILAEMNHLATGDLTVRLTVDGSDDIARLYGGFNEVVVNIRNAIGNVNEAVDATANTTDTIAQQAEQVTRSMTTQSRQANEIAAAVEEMSATIQENARQASLAAAEAERAQNDAGQGGMVVGEAISGIQNIAAIVERAAETISELGKSSEAIGEITKVIEEIADQTNLLALNAAIEAARAGDQGRGFAVVADEVRKLAERTQQATKEIAETIRRIQGQTAAAVREMNAGTVEVEKGQQSAAKAQEALQRIIERSGRVAETIAQVATASEEQSATMNHIAQSVDDIKKLTEQATAAMRQTAHSVENLYNLTQNLRELAAQFKLGSRAATEHLGNAKRRQLGS